MNWQTKARLQRAISRFPFAREEIYYQLQRRFGNLRNPAPPIEMIRLAAPIFAELEAAGMPVAGARILEVGAGHRINMPLAFYLAGAASIVSVDLYRILKADLIMRSVREFARDRHEIIRALSPFAPEARIASRIDTIARARDFNELRNIIRLDYRAPCDAAATGLPAASADIHFSYTVYEHIPRPDILAILREASRVISPRGLLCHHIDLSDHFSHDCESVSPINFLRFSSAEWARIAGQRFGYHNRLREPDFRDIYREACQEVLVWKCLVHENALRTIENGFPLAPEYAAADPRVLATTCVLAISRPTAGAGNCSSAATPPRAGLSRNAVV